ncbi:MAG TPA: Uma2 family endonuclease, partial [Anaerolineae bacterium]
MEFSPTTAVLQAKMQAWCVGLLSIPVDAYKIGAVIGKGAVIQTPDGDSLSPDVMFVAGQDRKIVTAGTVNGAPVLAIDMLQSQTPPSLRVNLRARYAAAHVLEYWQIEGDKGIAALYQANAMWDYDLIEPDKAGMHFSTA